jgi:type II secretory pathway pseudopilin PulG
MSNNKKNHPNVFKRGFTLVELLIVAPIIILFIAGFVGLVVTLVGSVLASNGSSTLTYNIQDALNRIDQDVRQSGAFLSTNNIALTSPQGYNNDTTNFENVNTTTGTMLILNAYATTGNPVNLTSITPIPASNEPNACSSTSVSQNTLVYINIVYFVKNNSLWRRVLAPANYPGIACSTPWQQASCSLGNTTTFCPANDADLVDNISAYGFSVNYYPTSSSTTADTTSIDATKSDAVRQVAMNATNTVGVTISASQTIAGRTVSQTGSVRSTSINDDTTATVSIVAPTMVTQPSASTVAMGSTATFTASATPTTGLSTQWQQSPDGGTTWANISGAQSTTLTLSNTTVYQDSYLYRVIFSNADGSVTSSSAKLTVTSTGWTNINLESGWGDYNNGFQTDGVRRTSAGVVILKGLLLKAGTVVSNEVVGILPFGYRPSEDLIFQTSTNSNVASRVDIYTDGTIRVVSGSGVWLSLEGINYLPANSGYTFTSLPLSGAWTYYATPWATPAYTIDSAGRVHLKGLVKGGSGNVAALPAAIKANYDLYLPEDSNDVFGDMVIVGSGNVITPVAYNNGYLSLQAMYYPTGSSGVGGWTLVTPNSAWTNYGGTYPPLEYTKSSDGIVMLEGFIKGGAVGSTVMTLPSGYRPAAEALTSQTGWDSYSRVDVTSTGAVIVESLANNGWLSLNNIQFYADGS